MFTLITCPLPWMDVTGIRQHNALQSWRLLTPPVEIIMFCNEWGTSQAAEQYHAQYGSDVRLTEVGYPSVQDILLQAAHYAYYDIIAWVDTDVILLDDFSPMVEYVASHYDNFCVNTGRYSIKLDCPVNFSNGWQDQLRKLIHRHHDHGSDYFIYRRGFFKSVPDFSIGAGTWDGWRMGYTIRQGAELINAKQVTQALHQDHGPRWRRHPARERNRQLAGPKKDHKWASDATVYLTKEMLCSSPS